MKSAVLARLQRLLGAASAAEAARLGGVLADIARCRARAARRVAETEGVGILDAIESALAEVTGRLHNQTLNQIEPFDRLNPSAEHVAQHIAKELSRRLVGVLPAGVRLASVRVTEAPGCAAIYRPDEGSHASP